MTVSFLSGIFHIDFYKPVPLGYICWHHGTKEIKKNVIMTVLQNYFKYINIQEQQIRMRLKQKHTNLNYITQT